MGTRAALGFRVNGKDFVSYCHFDGYPTGLGYQSARDFQSLLERYGIGELKKRVANLRLVNEGDTPAFADIEKFKHGADLRVSNQSPEDWYCLLRNAQGELASYLDNGVIIDSTKFLGDSLFCEWAYIYNLDDQILEIYEGFNKDPGAPGRYAHLRDSLNGEYRGVKLVLDVSFDALQNVDWERLEAREEAS